MNRYESPVARASRITGALSGKLHMWAGAGMLAGVVGVCQEPPPAGSAQQLVSGGAQQAAASAPVTPRLAPGAAAAVERPRQQTSRTRKYMLSHYADSVRLRMGIVAGDLAVARAAAAAVSEDTWTPRLRTDYQPFVKAVRDAAHAAQQARSLESAARALGDIGEACASCHLKFGGPGSPVAPVQLIEGADPAMVAHALATDQLWDGLISPSDASWLAGMRVLTDTPALGSDVEEVAAAAQHLRALARQGRVAKPAQRSKIFSSVLSTCAACHERLGVQVAAAVER
jgi:cytochrome c556